MKQYIFTIISKSTEKDEFNKNIWNETIECHRNCWNKWKIAITYFIYLILYIKVKKIITKCVILNKVFFNKETIFKDDSSINYCQYYWNKSLPDKINRLLISSSYI